MQKALQNENFKKVWEKVILNRHPKAKSLEEALALEISPFNGCMVAIDLTKLGYAMTTTEPLQVVSYNKFAYFAIEPVYSKLIKVWDSSEKKVQNNAQILGRPITLEDILYLLPDLNFGNDGLFTYLSSFNGSYDHETICDWQLTKPLHEQTEETWEVISNIIK
jgi:hypothetical protein